MFIKYCVVFVKKSRKFATSQSPALNCYFLYKKLPANRCDCTFALCWELWRSLTAMKAREGLQWIEKKHNFSWTPCSSLRHHQNNFSLTNSILSNHFLTVSTLKVVFRPLSGILASCTSITQSTLAIRRCMSLNVFSSAAPQYNYQWVDQHCKSKKNRGSLKFFLHLKLHNWKG